MAERRNQGLEDWIGDIIAPDGQIFAWGASIDREEIEPAGEARELPFLRASLGLKDSWETMDNDTSLGDGWVKPLLIDDLQAVLYRNAPSN
jgi:hypothetical protein